MPFLVVFRQLNIVNQEREHKVGKGSGLGIAGFVTFMVFVLMLSSLSFLLKGGFHLQKPVLKPTVNTNTNLFEGRKL